MRRYLQKHKWHLTIFVILLLIAGASWYFDFIMLDADSATQQKYPKSNIQYTNKTKNTNNKTQLQVIPTQGAGSRLYVGTNYKIQVTNTSTVYDAMKKSELNFKTKTFTGLGEFVEKINNLKNDPQNGKYWIYYINGEAAKLGISTQTVKPNDLIEWKYE